MMAGSYCEVCGEDSHDVMEHLDDEDLVNEIMGFAITHPDGFCKDCGSSKTIYEPDCDPYPCDECGGTIRHPQQVLGII